MMRATNAQWWAGYWFAMSEVSVERLESFDLGDVDADEEFVVVGNAFRRRGFKRTAVNVVAAVLTLQAYRI